MKPSLKQALFTALAAVLPMLATGGGRLMMLSTPVGQRGFFWETWEQGGPEWERVRATAEDCPRISRDFLDEQRRTLGDRWYRQEFMCSFEQNADQFFDTPAVLAAFETDEAAIFGE